MKTINSRFEIFAIVSVTVVAVLACFVLLGWFFLDSPIKNLFPGNQLSNPLTAVCFLSAAVSFGLINHKLKTVRKVGIGLALVIVLIALIKFSEILFSYHNDIDSLLFKGKLRIIGVEGKPNLMEPITVISFIITGIALALSRYKMRDKNTLADYFALGVTLTAAVSIIGYLYEALGFKSEQHHIPMAFSTAVCFLFISLAILLRRSEFGFFSLFTSKYQGSETARFLVPFTIIIPFLTGLLRLYSEQKELFSEGTGVALVAVLNTILFLFVIWRTIISSNKASMALEREVEVRRLAEQKIYENQELLKDLYDNAPTGYYSLDETGVFLNANLTTINWLGYTKEELIGMRLTDLLSTEDAENFNSLYSVFKKTGLISDLELYYTRKDGTTFPVLINSSAVRDQTGRYLYSRSTMMDNTERKKSEKVISDNEKRLQTFFKAGPDAIVVINQEHKILEWNPKAESIFGFSVDEAIGKYVYDLIIPTQYREAHKNGVKRFLNEAEGPILNRTVEITALHKDGHEFYVNFSISNVKVGNDWIFISFISDITERKKLEQEISQANIFLNSVLENIPHMVFVKDANNLKFVRLNKAGEELIGITEGELIGKSDYDFFPKQTADLYRSMDAEVLKNLSVLDIKEEKIQTSKGERWLHTKKIPLLDKHGRAAYLLGVSEDVTEQKKIQSVLNESNEKFLKLFYSSPLAMVIRNQENGRIMDVNEEYERLFSFKKEFLVGKTFAEIGLVSDPLLNIETPKNTGESVSLKNVETILYNSMKQPVDVIVSIEAIRLENTNCLICVLIDNTERKKLEGDLQEIHQELESFTYSVSHDLRAPLRIINGYAELIKEGWGHISSAEPLRMLEIIIASANQLGTLIDDLLNFSKLGKRQLITHNTDMNALVHSVLEKQLTGKLNYQVTVDALPKTCCDSSLIKQVWENVISNAVKYSANKREPAISIGAIRENGSDVFYVKDNGAGFDMKYYDKLFAVFQRLHKSSDFEGTGVGLALSQRIITKHGGRIWAESKLNEGSTFYFTVSKS